MTQSFDDFSKAKENEVVLWKDRKRHLGLPLSFTKYSVTKDKLRVKTGFFNTESNDVLLYRVLDVDVKRSFGQKIFGVGTVTIHASDRTSPTLSLVNVKKAEMVADYLQKLVEEARDLRNITGREMFGVGTGAVNVPGDYDGDGIPDHLESGIDVSVDNLDPTPYDDYGNS